MKRNGMCSDSVLSTLLKRGLAAAAAIEIMIYWYGLGLGDTDFGTFEMTPMSTHQHQGTSALNVNSLSGYSYRTFFLFIMYLFLF